jgi:hypothetical protein
LRVVYTVSTVLRYLSLGLQYHYVPIARAVAAIDYADANILAPPFMMMRIISSSLYPSKFVVNIDNLRAAPGHALSCCANVCFLGIVSVFLLIHSRIPS